MEWAASYAGKKSCACSTGRTSDKIQKVHFPKYKMKPFDFLPFRFRHFSKLNMKPFHFSTLRLFEFKMKPFHFSIFRHFGIENETLPLLDFSKKISPKGIHNCQKQKRFTNTQWVKYVFLPSPSYSRGRACKAQSQHKHCMKTIQKRLQYCGSWSANIPEARAKGFSQRTAARLTLHFIYLTYIIHISYVL